MSSIKAYTYVNIELNLSILGQKQKAKVQFSRLNNDCFLWSMPHYCWFLIINNVFHITNS